MAKAIVDYIWERERVKVDSILKYLDVNVDNGQVVPGVVEQLILQHFASKISQYSTSVLLPENLRAHLQLSV
jgi:hypothetical protein